VKRAHFQYALLFLLFVPTVVYQWQVFHHGFVRLVHPDRVVVPPIFPKTASAEIREVDSRAAAAGIHIGEVLVAVDGRPYTGSAVLGEELARRHAGDSLPVVVRGKQPGSPDRVVTIPLVARGGGLTGGLSLSLNLALAVLFIFTPATCSILGFLVAAVRPRDPLAWLLLALLLSFGTLVGMEVALLPAWVRTFAMVYRTATAATWPIWMFLFGHYFPAPPRYNRSTWWKWVKWSAITVALVETVLGLIISVGDLNHFASVTALNVKTTPLDRPTGIVFYCMVGYFFFSLSMKGFTTTTADNKRRLRLLYWGAFISLTPCFIISLIAFARGNGGFLESAVPLWIFLPALSLLLLFPLTLAYVIVVHRALDVRVVVRQGLKYALATGGVRVMQAIAILAAVFTALLFAANPERNRPQRITLMALAVLAAVVLSRVAQRLKLWLDRRFFRDAYNTEQVLSELSDEVRSIIETPRLLETVTRRISDALHVPRVAVLLGGQPFQPAYALGYNPPPQVSFSSGAATVRVLQQKREPARVYFDDPESWVYSDVTEEERQKLSDLHAELLLPISVREKLLGFITLGQKLSEEPYSGTDVRLLKSVAAQTGLALENARLTSEIAVEIAHREKLHREVQERLFPQAVPAIVGLDCSGFCRPALGVAGDYYDFLALPQGKLGVAVGDVSGKGIAAALLMASLQASLRSQAAGVGDDLAGLIRNVNRLVYEASASNRYATFFYAVYNPTDRQLTYVNAGHNPPMLFRQRGNDVEVIRLEVGGTVVGLLEDFAYEQGTIALSAGDILVAFTDGISEALTAQDEEFGEDQLIEAVKKGSALPASDLIRHILAATDAFTQSAPQHDDMTLVVLRVV
jgi:phosphoserine phosphatase RsbU/P